MNTKQEFEIKHCAEFIRICCELKTLKTQYKELVAYDKHLQSEVRTMWKYMNVVATKKSGLRGLENNQSLFFDSIGYRIARIGWLEYNDPIELLQHRLHSKKLELDRLVDEEANTKKRWYKFSKNAGKINTLTEEVRRLELLEQRYIENKKLIHVTEEMRKVQTKRSETHSRIDELDIKMHEICQQQKQKTGTYDSNHCTSDTRK